MKLLDVRGVCELYFYFMLLKMEVFFKEVVRRNVEMSIDLDIDIVEIFLIFKIELGDGGRSGVL